MEQKTHKLTKGQKISYGCGKAAILIQNGTKNQLAMPIFNDILGLDPRIIGIILSFTRIFDSLIDPFVGHLSDHTKSRFGRRIPWLAIAAPLCAITFAMIWFFPRGQTEMFYFTWLAASLLFFYICVTLYSIPFTALGMELTPDYHERTNVMAYGSAMASIGSLLISNVYLFVNWDIFHDMAHGMRYLGIILGVIILILSLIPVFFNREHPSLIKLKKKNPKQKISFSESLQLTVQNRPFLIIVLLTFCILIGITIASPLHYYITVYYVSGGIKDETTGLVLTLTGYACVVGGLIAMPIMTHLSKRFGKCKTLRIAFLCAIIGSSIKWICYNPNHPYLMLIPGFLMTFSTAMIWTLLNAILPDVVDYDNLKNHQHRGGMITAIYSLITKTGHAIALIISGFLLSLTGFNVSLGSGQSTHTILNLRIYYTIIPIIALLIALMLLQLYPLTEKRVLSIRKELYDKSD